MTSTTTSTRGTASRRLAAVACTVLASTTVLWAATTTPLSHSVSTGDELCSAFEDLRASFDVSTLGGQSGIRRAGSALAAVAERYPLRQQPNSAPARDASRGLRVVLELPYGTARDLWTAARPVAVACGADWRPWGGSADRLLNGG